MPMSCVLLLFIACSFPATLGRICMLASASAHSDGAPARAGCLLQRRAARRRQCLCMRPLPRRVHCCKNGTTCTSASRRASSCMRTMRACLLESTSPSVCGLGTGVRVVQGTLGAPGMARWRAHWHAGGGPFERKNKGRTRARSDFVYWFAIVCSSCRAAACLLLSLL